MDTGLMMAEMLGTTFNGYNVRTDPNMVDYITNRIRSRPSISRHDVRGKRKRLKFNRRVTKYNRPYVHIQSKRPKLRYSNGAKAVPKKYGYVFGPLGNKTLVIHPVAFDALKKESRER